MNKNKRVPLKIKNALQLIKCNENMKWSVPNRKMLKMSIKQFAEFERQRLLEFENKNIVQQKYWAHYGLEKPKEFKQMSIYDK